MIVAGGRTVVVDALFREGVVNYARTSAPIRESLEEATGAFSDLDLVLATHHHADHFDAEAVLRHLRSNPEARFVSTLQAVSLLEAAETPAGGGAGSESVMPRVTGAWPAEGDREAVAAGRIGVDLLNLHHGRRGEEVQNLGLLLDIDGFKVLHVGDTQATVEEVAVYGLGGEAVDVAFIPYWKLLEAEGPRPGARARGPTAGGGARAGGRCARVLLGGHGGTRRVDPPARSGLSRRPRVYPAGRELPLRLPGSPRQRTAGAVNLRTQPKRESTCRESVTSRTSCSSSCAS